MWEPKDREKYWSIEQDNKTGSFIVASKRREDYATGHFGAVMTMIYDGGTKTCPEYLKNKRNNNVFRTREQARKVLEHIKFDLKWNSGTI